MGGRGGKVKWELAAIRERGRSEWGLSSDARQEDGAGAHDRRVGSGLAPSRAAALHAWRRHGSSRERRANISGDAAAETGGR